MANSRILKQLSMCIVGLGFVQGVAAQDCQQPTVKYQFPVRFEASLATKIYLQGIDIAATRTVVVKDESGNTIASGEIHSNYVVVTNLSPDQTYYLWGKNACNQDVQLATIKDEMTNRQIGQVPVLDATPQMMNEIEEFQNRSHNGEPLKITNYLFEGQHSTDIFERLHYLQASVWSTKAFPQEVQQRLIGTGTSPSVEGGEPIPLDPIVMDSLINGTPVEIGGNINGCACVIMIDGTVVGKDNNVSSNGLVGYSSATKLQTPILKDDYTLNIAPKWLTEPNGPYIGFADWHSTQAKWTWSFINAGATSDNWMQGWCNGGANNIGKVREAYFSNFDSTGSASSTNTLNAIATPNSFNIGVLYTCHNDNGEQSNCGCEKPIDLYARYDESLKANANVQTSGSISNVNQRSAYAFVESISVLYEYSHKSGEGKYIDGGAYRLQRTDDYSLNPTFVTNAGELLHGIGSIIMEIYGAGEKTKFNSNGMNGINLGANVANMINANAYISQGGGNSWGSRNLISHKSQRSLVPNTRIDYTLMSGKTMKIGGKFDWYADLNASSNAALAIYIGGNGGDNCCNNNFLYYFAHSRPDAPIDYYSNRDILGFWLMGKGSFYNLTNAPFKQYPIPYSDQGRHFGPAPTGCKKPIDIQNKQSTSINELQNDAFVVGSENKIWFKGNTQNQTYTYSVYDVTGKLLIGGKTNNAEALLFEPPIGAPQQLYIIKIASQQYSTTKKVVL